MVEMSHHFVSVGGMVIGRPGMSTMCVFCQEELMFHQIGHLSWKYDSGWRRGRKNQHSLLLQLGFSLTQLSPSHALSYILYYTCMQYNGLSNQQISKLPMFFLSIPVFDKKYLGMNLLSINLQFSPSSHTCSYIK